MTAALLETVGLSVDLGGQRVVEAVSIRVEPGEVVGLIGRNGSGKTTLIRAALGLVRVAGGEARIGGDVARTLSQAERARRVGYLPQDRVIGWNLPAWRLAALGSPWLPKAEARQAALRALERAGASTLRDRGALDLSGGERAKVLLARLLATDAPLLVADEPIAGLDPAAQIETLEVLRAHSRSGGAVLATLHDLRLAARYCDHVVVMKAGRVVASDAAARVFTAAMLATAFGLEAVPG